MEQIKHTGDDNSGSLSVEQAKTALDKITKIKFVPIKRVMELALKAGHKCDIEGSKNPTHITEQQQLNYLKFFAAMSEALQEVAYNIDHISLEGIRQMAIDHAGYQPYDMPTSGNLDVMKMIASENVCVFYTRFAYQIAAELK